MMIEAALNAVTISLGSVVLDRPDQSGRFIAKDFSSGWAYIVADAEGDKRFRGQGSCAGGLASGLRYAVLSAIGCVPDSQRITIVVDTRQAHRQMVELAMSDAQVIGAISGRPMFVMTRPGERASFQTRIAAEHAAAAALQARERTERQAPLSEPAPEPVQAPAPATPPEQSSPAPRQRRARLGAALAGSRASLEVGRAPGRDRWRERAMAVLAGDATSLPDSPRVLSRWLQDFDQNVQSVTSDLRSVGC